MLADELADVVIYLDILAAQLGIDLGDAVMKKWNKTSEKVGAPLYIDAGVREMLRLAQRPRSRCVAQVLYEKCQLAKDADERHGPGIGGATTHRGRRRPAEERSRPYKAHVAGGWAPRTQGAGQRCCGDVGAYARRSTGAHDGARGGRTALVMGHRGSRKVHGLRNEPVDSTESVWHGRHQ